MYLMGLPIWLKLIIAVVVDVLDLFIGVIPGIGSIFDLVATFIAVMLAGPAGFIAAIELFTPGVMDAFFPTVTASVLAGTLVMGG